MLPSQCCPLNPLTHIHLILSPTILHVPPFLHSFASHTNGGGSKDKED